jgi:hypothetical protein
MLSSCVPSLFFLFVVVQTRIWALTRKGLLVDLRCPPSNNKKHDEEHEVTGKVGNEVGDEEKARDSAHETTE